MNNKKDYMHLNEMASDDILYNLMTKSSHDRRYICKFDGVSKIAISVFAFVIFYIMLYQYASIGLAETGRIDIRII